MKQTTKSLVWVLVLASVTLAIGFGAAWVGRDEEKKAEQKEKSARLFEGLERSKVRSLRLEKAGKLVALVSRADDKAPWKIAEPLPADADESAVNAMVDAALGLKQKSDLGTETDVKPYGLDAPRLRVTLKLDDGKEQGVEVGLDNPFDSTVYLRKSGEPTIRIAEGTSKSPFEKELFDLRDKRVAHLEESAEVQRLEVLGGPVSYTLVKDGKEWKLEAPVKGLADSGTADRLVGTLKSLKATRVQLEEIAPAAYVAYGLTPPKLTVKLSVLPAGAKDALTRTLLFAQPRPGEASVTVKTYAKRDDSATLYEVDNQVLKDLGKELFDLQDKQLTHLTREDVRRISFESPGAPRIVVARKKATLPDGGVGTDEEFAVLEPKAGPAKKAKLSSVLFSITGLRAAQFGEALASDQKALSKLGFDKPNLITVFGDGDKVLARLKIGGPLADGKRSWVVADGISHAVQVEKGSVADLPWKLDDVLETPPPLPAFLSPDGGLPAAAHAP